MGNISKQKRDEMINFLEDLKNQHNDDNSLIAINEIEKFLNTKKYGLVWEEHTERVDVEMETKIPVFNESKNREICSEEGIPYNFLIEGDNLHSLKLLEKTHKNKIDAIYIDPPYNRGKNDFIYDDNYIVSEDGFKHSKWLSFMNKRLLIAKKLLSDEGLIFISIDDYEIAQLKMLCDEVFGENNFINIFIWQRNSSGKTEKDKFTVNTEYILLYAKSSKFKLNDAYKPLAEASQKLYNKDDNDGRGRYQTVSLQKPRDPGPETTYDYVDNNGKVWACPPKGWRMKQEKIKALENDNRLVFTGKTLRVKDYWNERANTGKRIDTLWNDLSENSKASKDLEMILGVKGAFDNPKPVDLIARCLRIAPKNSTILDFFAGSGTTGQAVLDLNIEDGGNRKFILCTNNENNICEKVTYERLKTVITGKRQDGSQYSEGIEANLKYYKTAFIERYPEEELLEEQLLNYTAKMVQLENHVNIDNKKYIIITDEDEADEHITDNLEESITIYISSDVLLAKHQHLLIRNKNISLISIPKYYFNLEIQEAGA